MQPQGAVTPQIITHIERFLGQIKEGWDIGTGLQVIRCSNGYLSGVASFCTLGLSKIPLKSAVSNKIIFQELVVMCYEPAPSNLAAVLQQLASAAINHGCAYLAGEVIERDNSITKNSILRAFCAIPPSILPEKFASLKSKSSPSDIIFVWISPISGSEARFIRENGWGEMEDIFIQREVDLLDLYRGSTL